ncbi:hypothetical protein [Amaricoccus solimangrovi]|uniref:Uncharacterized protein n=1 Tax=Amaricoccus solimangrovi TaxID=2589815 RepID=A0A501X0D1_9RHOB|nr:hypothetical protein [Amaricoccus solimangrovi]TPE53061.1 hypothetical protein FJM51_03280 [Amaricoccus solimangrovi]
MDRLLAAIRADCDRNYALARPAARARALIHPLICAGTDMSDWRSHMGPTERELCEAAIEAGVWAPEGEDHGER